ncbi:MAG: lipoate--protein ligase family protein [Candidatus Omnitrophica bacterium]|nr:lipoate--protein ligase family protein [Candidatus Omnitrophota bacterium]
MLLKDISFQSPEENILYDEVLLHLAEKGRGEEVLRFWESPELFVCLGRICKEEEDLKAEKIAQEHIPVLRRCTGGGTVLQGKGCLNYSLILSKAHDPQIDDLRKSYQGILNKVIDALRRLNVEAVFYPVSDIALAEDYKKISGNAQKRSRKFILHHGTILYDFDLGAIERYLRMPEDIPEYRQGRSHSDFVTNAPLSAADIKDALKDVFNVDREEKHLDKEERDCLHLFLDTKTPRILF